jgi:hypothetical protein
MEDTLGFSLTSMERVIKPITKYKMLQEQHTLYDPMGILIPFLVTGKLLVQSC